MSGTILASCKGDAIEAGISSNFHLRIVGINITYMTVGTVVYFTIAVLADYTLSSSWYRALMYRLGRKTPPVSTRVEDSDVIDERNRVLGVSAGLAPTVIDASEDVLSLVVSGVGGCCFGCLACFSMMRIGLFSVLDSRWQRST